MNLQDFRLRRDDTALVVVDFQERLARVMPKEEAVVRNIRVLLLAAHRLGMPVLMTEQYPQGLGPTVAPIREVAAGVIPIEKLTFSCLGVEPFRNALEGTGRPKSLVLGMETHVCVYQTVMDLLASGYVVHVPEDAVCSRTEENRLRGLRVMEQAGAHVTSTELVLFDLLERAGTAEFKELQKLVV